MKILNELGLTKLVALIKSELDNKQNTLVSGSNIKTINNNSLLGSGNMSLQKTLISGTNIKTINDNSILGSGNISVPTKISDLTDDTSVNPVDKADTLTGLTSTVTELNYSDGVTSNIQTQLDNKEGADTTILKQADVVDDTETASAIYPLSANMGKELQDAINNLKNIGRFLAIWDCTTGLPLTDPVELPYTYRTGDYFRVGTVSTATPAVNYKPTGTTYNKVASTVTETASISVGAIYYFDGTTWRLQSAGSGGGIQDVQVNGTSVVSSGSGVANVLLKWGKIEGTLSEQTDLQGALNGKADSSHNQAASTITEGIFAGQVNADATAVATLGTSQVRNITISNLEPTSSAGNNGDVWIKY